ncbi:hypothetical protein V8E54_010455 [Elaphomyces granulatus]
MLIPACLNSCGWMRYRYGGQKRLTVSNLRPVDYYHGGMGQRPQPGKYGSIPSWKITQVIAFLAVAIVGAMATPGGHPPPPPPAKPTSVVQQISCSGNASPYCCSPNTWSVGTTCTGLIDSSVNCNGIVLCCNNNDGAQSCFSSIQGPVTIN